MSRSPLTESINKVTGMVTYVRENLSTEEYMLYLDMVAPQVEPEPAEKKTRKKRTTKSAKAQSLEGAIASSRDAKVEAPKANGQLCTAMVPGLDVVCGETEDKLIHDPNGGYGGYHPFVPAVPAVAKKLLRKAAAANNTPNSKIEKGAAMSAGS